MKIIILSFFYFFFFFIYLFNIRAFLFQCFLSFLCSFFISLKFFFLNTNSLSSSTNSIRRITNNCVKNTKFWFKHMFTCVLNPKIWLFQSVILKICKNIELFYLIQSFNLIFCLSSNSISFDNSDIEISSKNNCIKMLQSYGNTTSSNKWIINKITMLYLSLIYHQ